MQVDPRLHFLLRRLKEAQYDYFPNEKIRILDIGCADGSFMKLLCENIINFEAIDGLDVPSQWLKEPKVRSIGDLYIQDLQKGTGPIPLRHYHIVTLWEVIEHIENVYDFLRNLKRLLVPKGIVLLSTPNLFSLSRLIKGDAWVGIKDQTHKYLFDRLALDMVLSRSGFSGINISSYFFPSLSSKFDTVNNLFAAIPGGGMFFAKALNNKEEKKELSA